MFLTSFSFATLAATNMALLPTSRIFRAVSSPASVAMSVTTILAPSRAKSSAAACPIPLAEPVMMATLSLSLIKFLSPFDKPEHSRQLSIDLFYREAALVRQMRASPTR